MVAERCQYS